jgi:uncharacterized protein (TIGR03437 family)
MRLLCLVFLPPFMALAQVPAIEAGGVQNTASNTTIGSIAPGMAITIKGQNLAMSTEIATGYRLPSTLGGATVYFGGPSAAIKAPLTYASPSQINAVVPNGISGTAIVVTTAAGSSPIYSIPVVTATPPYAAGPLGIFTEDTSGCGQAVAYNVHADGSVSLNTPQNSLDPKKDAGLTIFLTGLGALDFNDRSDAIPWAYNSGDNLAPQMASAVTFGAPGLTAMTTNLATTYFGPAPDRVAIDQVNALGQWKGVPQGCKTPLSVALLQPVTINDIDLNAAPPADYVPFTASQLVDVSIQPGGGACSDPPDGGMGIVSFAQTMVSASSSGVSSTAAVTAQFIQGDGLGFPPPVPDAAWHPQTALDPGGLPFWQALLYGPVSTAAPACVASLPETLDAGALTLSGPVGSAAFQASTQNGRKTYQAAVPAGSVPGGTYQIEGKGGGQVGAFTANADIPAPISISQDVSSPNEFSPGFQPGSFLGSPCLRTGLFSYCRGSYGFSWTGGDDRSNVTVQFLVNGSFQILATTSAASQAIDVPSYYGDYPLNCFFFASTQTTCTLIPEGNVELIFTQTPATPTVNTFGAPGLGMGGEVTWKYVWDFRDLSN